MSQRSDGWDSEALGNVLLEGLKGGLLDSSLPARVLIGTTTLLRLVKHQRTGSL